jgi:UDP-N-acetylglucosamine diphosphorylase / glucose-1-phosphate thymidylyltransferase / UDP-N-acetylgalactosamine diphosphorylase / glucosamine-1-phosphate N-acetyltransferase / galactosamine-1-phosphate N-acetyltransferase
MQAVVMAAGEGRRLRPLTERYAKPVLPIDGRPVVVTLLHELAVAGLAPLTVVTGHLAEQVEALLAGFDFELRFARQPEAHGSADAVARANVEPPYVVAGADTVFAPGDVGRFVAGCAGYDGAIAVRRDPPPNPPHRSAVRVQDGLVTRVLDADATNPLAGAPLWFLGEALGVHLTDLPGPPYELAQAFQRAVDAGARVAGVEIGKTRNLTFPLDLVAENFPYVRGL